MLVNSYLVSKANPLYGSNLIRGKDMDLKTFDTMGTAISSLEGETDRLMSGFPKITEPECSICVHDGEYKNFKLSSDSLSMKNPPHNAEPSNPRDPDYDTRADEANEARLQEAIAAIREDADRVEEIITENVDIIQDIYFNYHDESGEENTLKLKFANDVINLINRNIEYCAASDIEGVE